VVEAVKFSELDEWVAGAGIEHSAAEIHGLVSGWICAGAQWKSDVHAATLQDWLGINLHGAGQALFDRLYAETATALQDEELGFRLFIPGDDVPVAVRASSVSEWCGGFLAGFGMTGRFQDGELGADLREVFEDLARISALSEEVPEGEENEVDLLEIAEYVRMSALFVFTECAGRALH